MICAYYSALKKRWRIAVRQFALFTVSDFLETAELGIERHEPYDPGVLAERTEGSSILVEVPSLIRVCFLVERFCFLLHTRGANLKCALHA